MPSDRRWTDADRKLVRSLQKAAAAWDPMCAEQADALLDALTADGWRPVPEGWRVQADRDGDMTLQCLTCFHDYDLDVGTEDLTLPRLVELADKHEHREGDDGA